MVQLPPEVLQVVIEHLHPTRDVRTLINVLQVSSTSWDLGARVLYRRIIIHAEAFHTLIGHCGDPFYPRTRRALGFVEFLGVDGTLHKTDIQRLAEICLPHVPLFPRVKSFHFDAGAAAGDSLEFPMPADRLVFDSPDVCLADEFNYAQLCLCLPAVHFGRITVHWEYADIFSAPHAPYALFPACPWRSFVNYALRGPELSYTPHDANLPARDLEEALERFPKLDAADEILAGRMAAQDLPRIQMLVPSGSLLHPHRMVDSLHFRLDRNHLERRVSARSTVEWVFYSKLDEVPPCPLCGGTWTEYAVPGTRLYGLGQVVASQVRAERAEDARDDRKARWKRATLALRGLEHTENADDWLPSGMSILDPDLRRKYFCYRDSGPLP